MGSGRNLQRVIEALRGSPWRWAVVALVAVVVLFAGFFGVQAARGYLAWNSVERVAFDPEGARALLPEVDLTPQAASATPSTTLPQDPVRYLSVLVIGSDAGKGREGTHGFADAVMLYLVPDDGSSPAVVSFPRDTIAVDPCTGEISSLVYMLEPCEALISGPEHVALAMEDLTQIEIDHFALIEWGAVPDVIDAVGGVEICSEYALRTGNFDVMPAGCSTLDGNHAFAFINSRSMQASVNGQWQFIEEMIGDEGRIRNREGLFFALLERVSEMRSPADLAAVGESVSNSLLLSETIGIGDLVAMAWDVRGRSDLRVLSIPVEGTTLPDGQTYAARPLATVQEVLEASE